MAKQCVMCDLDIPDSKDICEQCITELQRMSTAYDTRKKNQLKLYRAIVNFGDTDIWNKVYLVLALDLALAKDILADRLPDDLISHPNFSIHVAEMKGPFEAGIIYEHKYRCSQQDD